MTVRGNGQIGLWKTVEVSFSSVLDSIISLTHIWCHPTCCQAKMSRVWLVEIVLGLNRKEFRCIARCWHTEGELGLLRLQALVFDVACWCEGEDSRVQLQGDVAGG